MTDPLQSIFEDMYVIDINLAAYRNDINLPAPERDMATFIDQMQRVSQHVSWTINHIFGKHHNRDLYLDSRCGQFVPNGDSWQSGTTSADVRFAATRDGSQWDHLPFNRTGAAERTLVESGNIVLASIHIKANIFFILRFCIQNKCVLLLLNQWTVYT